MDSGGATTSVDVVNPDVALVLEGSIAGDVPGLIEHVPIKLSGGPLISFCEARMIPNTRLRDLVVDTAKKHDIPFQIAASSEGGGATEGAIIHLHKSGVPTLVICVPCRHIHSHTGIMHRDDFDYAVKLLTEILRKLDQKTVTALTTW